MLALQASLILPLRIQEPDSHYHHHLHNQSPLGDIQNQIISALCDRLFENYSIEMFAGFPSMLEVTTAAGPILKVHTISHFWIPFRLNIIDLLVLYFQ